MMILLQPRELLVDYTSNERKMHLYGRLKSFRSCIENRCYFTFVYVRFCTFLNMSVKKFTTVQNDLNMKLSYFDYPVRDIIQLLTSMR